MFDAHINSHHFFFFQVKVTILFCVGGNLLWFTYNGSRDIYNMVHLDQQTCNLGLKISIAFSRTFCFSFSIVSYSLRLIQARLKSLKGGVNCCPPRQHSTMNSFPLHCNYLHLNNILSSGKISNSCEDNQKLYALCFLLKLYHSEIQAKPFLIALGQTQLSNVVKSHRDNILNIFYLN